MKILVTGAGGMVGRNLLADARAAEHQVLHPSRAELDLADGAACQAYVDRTAPDAVIHLAARVGGIAANIAAPADFLANNLAIGVNLLTAARRAQTPAFVNLGSSCMYPAGQDQPLTEDRLLGGPLEPTNASYALAKLAIWKLAAAIGEEDPGRVYRTLIPPNLYGNFDSFDPIGSHLVAAAIRKVDAAVRRGEDTVEIWGDGLARREFMFAADLADFIWRHIGRLQTLPPCMNVGVGADHSVHDYYRGVAEVMGFKGGFTHDRTKPVGARRKLLDVTAQTALGWRPATALVDGIAAAAEYYRSTGGRHGSR